MQSFHSSGRDHGPSVRRFRAPRPLRPVSASPGGLSPGELDRTADLSAHSRSCDRCSRRRLRRGFCGRRLRGSFASVRWRGCLRRVVSNVNGANLVAELVGLVSADALARLAREKCLDELDRILLSDELGSFERRLLLLYSKEAVFP